MILFIITSFILLVVYLFLILRVVIGFIKCKTTHENYIEEKKISVVIAARNEEENITKCLLSIIHQSINKDDYEVIVVDDHSTDSTFDVVNLLADKSDVKIKIIKNNRLNSGKKEAIRKGVQVATYDFIAVTDADCEVPVNWLKNMRSSKAAMIIAPVYVKSAGTFTSVLDCMEMLILQAFTFSSFYYKNPILNNAANMGFTKAAYFEAGEKCSAKIPSGDDIFFLHRVSENDKMIEAFLLKEMVVKTTGCSNIQELLQQKVRWASKYKYYTKSLLKKLSIFIFIVNVFVIVQIGFLIYDDFFFSYFLILLLSKWVIDFILLFLVSRFFDSIKTMLYFVPVQIVYPFYVLLVAILSLKGKYKWKGRVYKV